MLTSLVFALGSKSYSQSISLGIETGLGKSKTYSSEITSDNYLDLSKNSKLGFTFNTTIEYYPKLSILSVNSGIGYFQKGDQIHDFHYASIPLYVRLSFGARLKVYFGGGTYGSLLINQNRLVDGYYHDFNVFDIGGLLNAGISYNTEVLKIFLDYKSMIGIAEIMNSPYGGHKNYSHYFQIGSAIKLKL